MLVKVGGLLKGVPALGHIIDLKGGIAVTKLGVVSNVQSQQNKRGMEAIDVVVVDYVLPGMSV